MLLFYIIPPKQSPTTTATTTQSYPNYLQPQSPFLLTSTYPCVSKSFDKTKTEKVCQNFWYMINDWTNTEKSWCSANVLQMPKQKREH